MSQLSFFKGALQTVQPSARLSTSTLQPRSARPKSIRQQLLQIISAAPTPAIAAPPARPIPPAPLPARELPQGWVNPNDPNFNYLKNCRLCGAPIKIGGLDHSLCSGDCGWVVDLTWKKWQDELEAAKRLKRSSQEAQAATHAEQLDRSDESETLDLFTYGLDDTSEAVGGVA
ncbi:MAG: hypothetical protein F6K28_20955 [Microcoleus sp. SIO2G3]|nr:hypothetical protein [Microcoleus sp. SIO2G3]